MTTPEIPSNSSEHNLQPMTFDVSRKDLMRDDSEDYQLVTEGTKSFGSFARKLAGNTDILGFEVGEIERDLTVTMVLKSKGSLNEERPSYVAAQHAFKNLREELEKTEGIRAYAWFIMSNSFDEAFKPEDTSSPLYELNRVLGYGGRENVMRVRFI